MKHTLDLTTLKADSNGSVWYKLHVLLYDLRHFEQSNQSRSRLESVTDPSYLGEPYFNLSQAEMIKTIRVETDKTLATIIEDTLNERLNRRMKKRVGSGDYRVCAAHDIAPCLEKLLGINPKNLEKNQAFVDTMTKYGLHLERGTRFAGLDQKHKTVSSKVDKKKAKD